MRTRQLLTPASRHLFFPMTLLFLTFGGAAAQTGTKSATDGTTPLGMTPGAPAGSYALSGFDNVNLYNGHLNFSLPLPNRRFL